MATKKPIYFAKHVSKICVELVPPPEGTVCMHVDAALFPTEGRMGWGAVLRDHQGAFILSCSEGLMEFPDPEVAKGLAIRQASTTLRDHGFQKVLIASDCLTMVQRITSSAQDRSPVASVVKDIKVLTGGFNSCSFKHVSRSFNIIAHRLARSSVVSVCNISIGVIPGIIQAELCTDIM